MRRAPRRAYACAWHHLFPEAPPQRSQRSELSHASAGPPAPARADGTSVACTPGTDAHLQVGVLRRVGAGCAHYRGRATCCSAAVAFVGAAVCGGRGGVHPSGVGGLRCRRASCGPESCRGDAEERGKVGTCNRAAASAQRGTGLEGGAVWRMPAQQASERLTKQHTRSLKSAAVRQGHRSKQCNAVDAFVNGKHACASFISDRQQPALEQRPARASCLAPSHWR